MWSTDHSILGNKKDRTVIKVSRNTDCSTDTPGDTDKDHRRTTGPITRYNLYITIRHYMYFPIAPPPQCVDVATQTDNSFINYLHLQTTPPNIQSEVNQGTPPNYDTDAVSSIIFTGISQPSLSRTVSSLSPPSSTPQSQSVTPTKSLFTPPELSNCSHTPFRTPDDTREIIRNLRSRAQKTKELLSHANHTHKTQTMYCN